MNNTKTKRNKQATPPNFTTLERFHATVFMILNSP
jgi:hypothetical protein